MSILDHFPEGFTPREQQKQILSGIEDACAKGKKFIVVQAPTGCGKSFIAGTIANYCRSPHQTFVEIAKKHDLFRRGREGGFFYVPTINGLPSFGTAVLTCTKALQNQYVNMFTSAQGLKGKQNYVCAVDEDFDCDIAPCTQSGKILEQCKIENRCPFLNARRDTFISKFGVYNYSVFMSLPKFLQYRQFLICDEASELEDQLVQHYSCTINYTIGRFKELKIEKLQTDQKDGAYKWLNTVYDKLKYHHDSLTNIFDTKNNKRERNSIIVKLRLYKQLLERIGLVLENWAESDYIIEFSAKDCTFTPLYVSKIAENLFRSADHVILMSGTIIDHEHFCKVLGIKDYHYIEVDSGFDPDKSPIYCTDKFKLNHKNLDEYLPKMVKLVKKICDQYPTEKGIVHTHTMKITEAVQRATKNEGRFLLRQPGITNEIIVAEHMMSKEPTVLISPSLSFGTDLADDHGRFCVIMKTPYLPLGNKRIKALFDKNKRWYQMKALVNLVQMCGRTTRNDKDFSDTYILDGTAVDLITRNKGKLPVWFRKRLK